MKKHFIFIIILATSMSCAKKEINIPVLAAKGVQEVHNHSIVWIFFSKENNKPIAQINRKNTISSTHWIYNIDKKLPLHTFIEDLKILKEKHANSIHSIEGMHDYFSYSDSTSNKLSFFEFDDVKFKTDSLLSKYYIKKNSELYKDFNNINITFNPNNIWINDGKFEKENFKILLQEFIEFSSEGKQTMLHLNFNNNLLYHDFLHYKTLINRICNETISTNTIEFVFNQEKVPDCGCE